MATVLRTEKPCDENRRRTDKNIISVVSTGDSLAMAAKKADIKAFHAGISRMLQNRRYLGDEYYPAIIDPDTFEAAIAERIRRAENLAESASQNKVPKWSIPLFSASVKAQNGLTTRSSRRNMPTAAPKKYYRIQLARFLSRKMPMLCQKVKAAGFTDAFIKYSE